MIFAIIVAIAIIAVVGVGVVVGAPFVPTRKKWIREALDLAGVSRNDVIVDLGSGDGAVLKMAIENGAKRAVGYEINPILVLWSRIRLHKFREKIEIHDTDFFHAKLPPDTTVVYLFQVDRVLKKLNKFIIQQRSQLITKKLRVVCFGFVIPGQKPVKILNGMQLYHF